MRLRQGVCQASPLSAHLLSLPFLQSGIAIHDLDDLAAIKAQPAAALARLPFTVEQPNHAQRLPCVVARAEGAVGFYTGLFKLVEVNPALDGLRRAITEFLLQLGDPVPELGFPGVALALPGPGEIPPSLSVDATGFQPAGAVLVARRTRQLAGRSFDRVTSTKHSLPGRRQHEQLCPASGRGEPATR